MDKSKIMSLLQTGRGDRIVAVRNEVSQGAVRFPNGEVGRYSDLTHHLVAAGSSFDVVHCNQQSSVIDIGADEHLLYDGTGWRWQPQQEGSNQRLLRYSPYPLPKPLPTLAGDPWRAVFVLLPDHGWAVGVGGLMAGYFWNDWHVLSHSPTTNNLNSVFFTSQEEGWAVGDAGIILFYTDTGWHPAAQGIVDDDLLDVCMATSSYGYIAGRQTKLRYIRRAWLVDNFD